MKIIAEDAQPVTQLRKSVPPNVAAAVAKSLEKLPADRFATAREFSEALHDPRFRIGDGSDGASWTGQPGPSRRLLAAVVTLGLIFLAAALWGWLRPRPVPPVIRYGLALPPSQGMIPGSPTPYVAPDGSILYVGPAAEGSQLWLKRRNSYLATPIPGTAGAASFTMSPDGAWVAFIVNGRLSKVPIGGGSPVLLASDNLASTYGLAWLDDGTLVYPLRGAAGLMRVPDAGGTPTLLMRSDSLITLQPNPLPGGHGVLFQSCNAGCATSEVWGIGLSGGAPRRLVNGASAGVFVAPNHLVYSSNAGGLFAVPFDPARLEVTGTAVPLDEVLPDNGGTQQFHVSAGGTLLMMVGGGAGVAGRTFEMVWVDRTGHETPVDTSWSFQLTAIANNHGWALSPDGTRLAIGLATSSGDDIWVKPLPTGAPYRVTFDPLPEDRPRWTPDNQYITFVGIRRPGGIYRHRADGTGTDSLLVAGTMDEGVVSPDGRWLVLRQGSVGSVRGGRNITGVRLGTDTVPVPVLSTEFDEEAIALSPDGKWMAYQSDETGRTEIFVRPFPNTDAGKRQVSSGGGVAPLWSRDGTQLFWLSSGKDMMAARITAGATIDVGAPVALFHVRDALLGPESSWYTPWDVARDGRFIMARLVGGNNDQGGAIVVVENWLSELETKAKR